MRKRLFLLAVLCIIIGLEGCQTTEPIEESPVPPTISKEVLPTQDVVPTQEIVSTQEAEKPSPTETVKVTVEVKVTDTPQITEEVKPTSTPKPTQKPEAEPEPTEKPAITHTPTPVPEQRITNTTALMFPLPDDSKHAWKNPWVESETNTTLSYRNTFLPEKGEISIKLCFPRDLELSKRGDSFELFLNQEGRGFIIDDCKKVGVLGEDWVCYEFKSEYQTTRKKIEILIKTHSETGSQGVVFGIADIRIKDCATGENRQIDLQRDDVKITVRKGDFFTNEIEEQEYELYRAEGETLEKIEQNEQITDEKQNESNEGLNTITFRLPESSSGWGDTWSESEVNIVIEYSAASSLSGGTLQATLCIPKLSNAKREDVFEIAVHALDDFYNWSGESVTVRYDGNRMETTTSQGIKNEVIDSGSFYQIKMEVGYDSSKIKDDTELQLIIKTHSDVPYGAYEVTLKEITVNDAQMGRRVLDLSARNVFLEGRMYATGESVDYVLSKDLSVFYIKNSISKMPIHVNYSLEVNHVENETVSYASSEPAVITVDDKGIMTSHQEGSSEITVTNQITGEKKCFTVIVRKPQIIGKDYEVLMLSGSEAQFKFTTEFAIKEGTYTFTSTKPEIATIDESGNVKALKDGMTGIKVEDIVNGATHSFELEVYTPEDKDGIGQYISMKRTNYVTADIAKRSYQLLYDVYKKVFDYFNYGEYEDVTLYFTVNDYSPAYSDSRDVYLASEHMLANAKDVDCITHELIHCAQNHISVWDDVWLMEGLTDYGRDLFGLHNEDCGWTLQPYQEGMHYTNSYTITGMFIKYVTDTYCKDMPHIINKMFKGDGGYDEGIWKENTGYTIDELWEMYKKSGFGRK